MSTFLSPAQAAKVAKVSRRTIMRAVDAKHLPAHPDNKNQWRIRPEDLEAWRSAHPAHWAPTEQAPEDAQPAHPVAHPAQEDAHLDKALREEVETLRKERDDLKNSLTVVTVRLEETEKRATIFERAKDAAEVDRDAWRQQAQALTQKLAERPVAVETPAPALEKPQEPDKSQEAAEALQKRLEWAEARMLVAQRALERVQDQSAETPVRVRRGLLAWFRGR